MMTRWSAFKTLIGMITGVKRASNRPYRLSLITELLKHRSLKKADEIVINSLSVKLKQGDQYHDLMTDRMPMSDEERETVRALLVLILPKSMICHKTYDPKSSLPYQCTYSFTKH